MRYDVLGVGIDAVTEAEALDRIAALVREGGPHQVVTANPEILDNATRTPALHALINRADLVTADGQGVLLAGRILGTPFPARVTGIELAEALCREPFMLLEKGDNAEISHFFAQNGLMDVVRFC